MRVRVGFTLSVVGWSVGFMLGIPYVLFCPLSRPKNFCPGDIFNLLNPAGYERHQQFNIQQLYALLTLYLCVLYLSENKQRLVPLTS